MSSYPFPNLFIVGVQKAGTTALASFLSQHPDICLVEGKEAHVFDDPQYHTATDKFTFAKQKYESKLKHYSGEKFILDATPITLFHPAFIKAASQTCPNAKFIIMLRDPIERALSHYAMTKSRGLEPHSPTVAFLLEPWRMRGVSENLPTAPFESKYRDQSYLTRGLYQRQISQLQKYVSRENFFVSHQSKLIAEHEKSLTEIFAFLQIPSIEIEKKTVFESKTQYSLPWIIKKGLRLFLYRQSDNSLF